MDVSFFPKRLRYARKCVGLSQRQLGELIGIDPSGASSRINRYETGIRSPKISTVLHIAKVLSVFPSFFYEPDEMMAEIIFRISKLNSQHRMDILAWVSIIVSGKEVEGGSLSLLEDQQSDSTLLKGYGVFIINDLGEYLDANPAASQLTGYSIQELCDLTIMDLTPSQTHNEIRETFTSLKKNKQFSGEITLQIKNGEEIQVYLDAVSMLDNRFLGVCREATQRPGDKSREGAIEITKETTQPTGGDNNV